MLTDYKFWYIRRDDDGFITECAVRFYEGEINTRYEIDRDEKLVPVTRYRRMHRLKKEDLTHLKGEFTKEMNMNDAKLYFVRDFGKIKTDNELRLFLNKELAKDELRSPIDEQKWPL